jgi:hypothetical protein
MRGDDEMSVVLYELNGDKSFLLNDSEWGPILSLIRLSEVMPADEADWEEMRDGYAVNVENTRKISKFVAGYLDDNAEGDIFGIDEDIPPEEGEMTANGGERTTQATFAVSRKRVEAFSQFCAAVEEGFSIW